MPAAGRLFFDWIGSANVGSELWTFDNSSQPHLVVDLTPTIGNSSSPGNFTTVKNHVFFTATSDVSVDHILYVTDGTAAGTIPLLTYPSGGGYEPENLVNVNGTLYFTSTYNGSNLELWKSDGTPNGTTFVSDISLTGFDNPTAVGNKVFFLGTDNQHGRELWMSDGTTTALVKDVRPGSQSGLDTSFSDLTNVGGTLYFVATDGLDVDGRELWKSDGTAAGTVMVKDIATGHDVNNNNNAYESDPAYLTNVNGTLFFAARDDNATVAHGNELWKSDGTAAGTTMVADIVSGSGSSFPIGLTNVSGSLFFFAYTPASNYQLWKSDGTAAGTVMVKTINPTGSAYVTGITAPVNVNGVLYFAADDGVHGTELWRSDRSAAGTVMVSDLNQQAAGAGTASSTPVDLTNVNGTLYFIADIGNGPTLYKTARNSNTITAVSVAGSGHLDPATLLATFASGAAPANDFNGDGSSDILWRNASSGQIGYWNSNGSGGFTYKTINLGDLTWQILGSGDFNGDGSADILWRNTVTGQVGPWNSNASGGFTPQIFNEGDLTWQVQGIGDFNGDGSSDILWRNTTTGQVGIWASNGSGGFTYQTINQGDLSWQIQGVGDFNGDGSADMLWRNTTSGQIGIWDSNGFGGFIYQIINQGDLTWQIQGIGDFNGDGNADILWRNTNTGQLGIWDSNGSGGFTYQVINQGDLTWQIVGVGDFNGDGKADILWRNTVTGQVGPWNSNSSGGFTPQVFNEGDLSWNTLNGNDTLVASTASATLFGNPGNTTFAIGPSAGQDKIYNFATGQDTLQFNHALFVNFAAAMTNATQVGANTVFAIDANDSVTLEKVNKSSLAASNFSFV
jgi:ELWxxDGT repeat protein